MEYGVVDSKRKAAEIMGSELLRWWIGVELLITSVELRNNYRRRAAE